MDVCILAHLHSSQQASGSEKYVYTSFFFCLVSRFFAKAMSALDEKQRIYLVKPYEGKARCPQSGI